MPGRSEATLQLVLSCEHGGNRVPPRWRALFRGNQERLWSHRGWDPGALRLARFLSGRLGAPLVATTVTRLLVETNRSLGHPRLFSEVTRGLPDDERARILALHWRPHRERVRDAVSERLRRGPVLHVGVHSFTPVLDGEVRDVDVGVLYDPARRRERAFCRAWIRELCRALPELRVRANAPYRGTSDGLTTTLRRELGEGYLGVELEVSQALLSGRGRTRIAAAVAHTLEGGLRSGVSRWRGGGPPSAAGPSGVPAKAPAGQRLPRSSARALPKRTTPTSG